MSTTSAIIPTHNRLDELCVCLDSLQELELPELEIVVVDNGSDDGTVEMVDQRRGVRLVRNRDNRGAAMAKNQGVASSSGDTLWFLDSDTVVPSAGVVRHALSILDVDSRAGAVGGEIYQRGDGSREWRQKVLLLNAETQTLSHEGGYGGTIEVDYLPSCNLFVRRAVFEEVGGFDPGYFFLMEDTDLCHRLRELGYRCLVSDSTAIEHRLVLRDRRGDLFLSHRNRVRFSLLNHPPWRVAALPVLDLAYTVSPYKLWALWGGKISAVKHLSPRVRGMRSGPLGFPAKLAAVGTDYLVALARAYAWNARHLRQTLRLRRAGRRRFL